MSTVSVSSPSSYQLLPLSIMATGRFYNLCHFCIKLDDFCDFFSHPCTIPIPSLSVLSSYPPLFSTPQVHTPSRPVDQCSHSTSVSHHAGVCQSTGSEIAASASRLALPSADPFSFWHFTYQHFFRSGLFLPLFPLLVPLLLFPLILQHRHLLEHIHLVAW